MNQQTQAVPVDIEHVQDELRDLATMLRMLADDIDNMRSHVHEPNAVAETERVGERIEYVSRFAVRAAVMLRGRLDIDQARRLNIAGLSPDYAEMYPVREPVN